MEELGLKDAADVPHIYASGRTGYASDDPHAKSGTDRRRCSTSSSPTSRGRKSTSTRRSG